MRDKVAWIVIVFWLCLTLCKHFLFSWDNGSTWTGNKQINEQRNDVLHLKWFTVYKAINAHIFSIEPVNHLGHRHDKEYFLLWRNCNLSNFNNCNHRAESERTDVNPELWLSMLLLTWGPRSQGIYTLEKSFHHVFSLVTSSESLPLRSRCPRVTFGFVLCRLLISYKLCN